MVPSVSTSPASGYIRSRSCGARYNGLRPFRPCPLHSPRQEPDLSSVPATTLSLAGGSRSPSHPSLLAGGSRSPSLCQRPGFLAVPATSDMLNGGSRSPSYPSLLARGSRSPSPRQGPDLLSVPLSTLDRSNTTVLAESARPRTPGHLPKRSVRWADLLETHSGPIPLSASHSLEALLDELLPLQSVDEHSLRLPDIFPSLADLSSAGRATLTLKHPFGHQPVVHPPLCCR